MSGEADVFPRRFGNYLLLARIATGGMGSVFLAQHGLVAGMEKRCVVKTVKPSLTEDEEYVRRFADEARVVVQLSHRNICSVFDVGRASGRHYLAMELVAGVDLGAVVRRLGEQKQRLDTQIALHVVCEILDALDYAHRLTDARTAESLRIVHRDVSPHNVMISYEGEVKLIDFGLAVSALKGESTAPNVVLGKLSYMAPEQARGEAVDGRADLYSTAVIAFELLANERYYAGLTPSELSLSLGAGDFINPRLAQLPAPLGDILKRALNPDRGARFASCAELKDQLESVLVGTGFRGGARSLRALLASAMPDAIEAWRSLISGATDAAAAAPVAAPPAERSESLASASSDTEPTASGAASPGASLDAHGGRTMPLTAANVHQRPMVAAGVLATLVAIAVGVVWVVVRGADPAASPQQVAQGPSPQALPAPEPAVTEPSPIAIAPADAGAPPGSTSAPKASRPAATKPAPKAPPSTKPMRLPQMIAALKSCNRPCAASLVAREQTLGQLEPAEINAFRAQATACLASCQP